MTFSSAAYRKVCALSIWALFISLSLTAAHVHAAANDSSINFKKDPTTGLFTLTVRDPDGIQEFSLFPVGGSSYGGGLSGCKTSFSNNNVRFGDPDSFIPFMPAYVIDCKNNTAELQIPPPVKGIANSSAVKKEVLQPPPPPPPPPKAEEKKEGPLSGEDIRYPVRELGNCGSEAECRSYCDASDNAKACLAFAKKYNLISEQEFKEAEDRFLNITKGPGGCNSGKSCEEYCNNVDHLDVCIAFAEKTGYYSPEELVEAKKFQELAKSGTQFPGGCKDRNTCEIYCNDPNHMEECLNFAEESGFLPKDEIEQARKILPLMKSGQTPGGCTSKEKCEKYCSADEHLNECIAFAEKAGLLSDEEKEMIKKTGGRGPGGCRSKAQCDVYCQENSEECFRFAQEYGLISEADLEHMQKGMQQLKTNLDKMPPEAVLCMKDAVGEENFNSMLDGKPIFDRGMEGKMKSCFSQITAQVSQQLNALPPEAAQCIKDTIGEDGLKKLQSGEGAENIDFSSLEGCFQQLHASFGGGSPGGSGGPGGPGGFSGPGGCKSIDECTAYCQNHLDECQQFAPPGGGGSGGGFPGGGQTGGQFPGGGATGGEFPGGPGGCKSQDECTAYCKANPDNEDCKKMIGGSGGPGGPGGFSGPGGCRNAQECITYCTAHYTDPACASYIGGGGSSGGGTGGPGGGSQAESCVSVPSGLVSWWRAEENASDSANGNGGTVSGDVAFGAGKAGKAFQFGGSGSVNVGNPSNLNFGTGPFSLETWFNWSGGSSVNNIIRKSNYPSSGSGSGYWLRVGNGTLEFSVGETTKPEGQTLITAPVSQGVWHHAVGVKENSGDVTLYVDGRSQGTILRQVPNTNSTSEDPFTIGSWRSGTEFFSGLIDEVSVYNRALREPEVRALFNAGSRGKCSTSSGSSEQQYQSPTQQTPSGGYGGGQQIPQEYCSGFETVPSCSYVGSPDSQNYQYCKQCFPNK